MVTEILEDLLIQPEEKFDNQIITELKHDVTQNNLSTNKSDNS
jgi:hypothetical protein